MKSRIAKVLLSMLFIGFTAGQEVSALMLKIPLSELKEKSDSIVRGDVISTKSEWNEEGNFIWTYVGVKVSKWIKDKGRGEEVITVKIPGGTVGDITQGSSDQVTFKKGEEVLLFLRKEAYLNKEHFQVVGMEQGKYTIEGGKIKEKGISADKFIKEIKKK